MGNVDRAAQLSNPTARELAFVNILWAVVRGLGITLV